MASKRVAKSISDVILMPFNFKTPGAKLMMMGVSASGLANFFLRFARPRLWPRHLNSGLANLSGHAIK